MLNGDLLQIADDDDEKVLCLTESELLKVLEEQVVLLLKACPNQQIPVPEFLTAFLHCHGHSIRLSDYSAHSVVELIQMIPNAAQVFCTPRGLRYAKRSLMS